MNIKMKFWDIWYYLTLPFRILLIFAILLLTRTGDDYVDYPTDEELALFCEKGEQK